MYLNIHYEEDMKQALWLTHNHVDRCVVVYDTYIVSINVIIQLHDILQCNYCLTTWYIMEMSKGIIYGNLVYLVCK